LNHQLVIDQTAAWLDEVVIGLGLCPFAATPRRQGRVVFRVCDGSAPEVIYREVLQALEAFLLADALEQETALVIVPGGLEEFSEYLELLQALDDSLESAGLNQWVQLASFHPAYRFDGAAPDDPANFTNRSPHPMFHIIREESLTQALADYPEPEAIPLRNVQRLRQIGADGMATLLNATLERGAG
jgi:hypothetical protein